MADRSPQVRSRLPDLESGGVGSAQGLLALIRWCRPLAPDTSLLEIHPALVRLEQRFPAGKRPEMALRVKAR